MWGGGIHQDTIWTADGSPYIVIQNVNVLEGITLTIKPGVRVEFNEGFGIAIAGQLIAIGAAGNPIVFTSALNDPNSGDWGSIEFTSTAIGSTYNNSGEYISGSILEYTTIEYGKDAVYANNAAPYLYNVLFRYNETALKCVDAETVIKESSFIDNKGDSGGAIYCTSTYYSAATLPEGGTTFSLTISDSIFTGNKARKDGGAICSFASSSSSSSSITITNSTFTDNDAKENGGAISYHSRFTYKTPEIYNTASLTITGCTFNTNKGESIGGAIYYRSNSEYSLLSITDSIVTDNKSSGSSGIMCYFTHSSSITIMGSTFTGNEGGGGAFHHSSPSESSVTITDSTFTDNTSKLSGGAIWGNADGPYCSVTITNCTFADNTAGDSGGAIYGDFFSITITDCTFIGNKARKDGGAIYCFCYSRKPSLTISDSTFTNNAVYYDGGAIYVVGYIFLDINNSIIYENFGDTAVLLQKGIFTKCSIINNLPVVGKQSSLSGNGIAFKYSFSITDCNIFGHKNYNIINNSEEDITATANYWGTTDNSNIALSIFDKFDDGTKGEVIYNPFLSNKAPGPLPSSPKTDIDGDGYTTTHGDCNDNSNRIHPGAIEICGDGIDQDCNGTDLACMDAPLPPNGVTASDGTLSGKVQVTWTPPTGAASYDVFRADMPAWTGTAPKRIASSVSGTSYDDTSAISGSRYYYWVKSRNSDGVSKYSMFDAGYWGSMGVIPAVPTNVSASDGTVSGKVNITWDATANTLIYEIWRADIPTFLGGSLKKVGTSATTSYSDATVANGNRYYYWVKARNSWGVSRYSIFDTGYTGAASSPLAAPTGVSATDGTVSGKLTITWNATSGSVVYEVWRATDLVSAGGRPVRIGFLSGTSFDDTSGASGTSYYYWVKSRDSWGSSKYSLPDTGYRN